MAALSPRARRAVTLMFLAAVVIGATAVFYLRPSGSVQPSAAVTTFRPYPVQRAGDVVFYSFVSLALGWAAQSPQPSGRDESGTYSIFKTVDGGKHWRRQLSGDSPFIFTTVSTFRFADALHGFLVAGDPMALYRTSDGGEHWARLKLPTSDAPAVQFIDAHNMWLYARSRAEPQVVFHLYASSDGGETWAPRPDAPANYFPFFQNGADGWAGSSDQSFPRVYVTADGGLTWKPRDLPLEPDTPKPVTTGVLLLPGSGAVALVYPPGGGVGGFHSYTSFDGGASWSAIVAAGPRDQVSESIYAFADATHWWSIQDGALYKTSNAGRSWTPIAVEPPGLHLLRAFDSKRAWAQLDEGYGTELVSTSDGGLHWSRANVPIA